MKQADVIIVGAGPAGCSAAHFLARAGVRVILLDKETFPRDKSCGDGIGRASLAQLARIGLDGWVKAGCFQTPKYVRIGAPSGEIVNILIRAHFSEKLGLTSYGPVLVNSSGPEGSSPAANWTPRWWGQRPGLAPI